MKKINLFLGTALWGWAVARKTAFSLLDNFYAAGFRHIDTAANYPIDKDPEHFRAAESYIRAWIAAHKIDDLKITVKVGSLDNSGSPDNNLAFSFLLLSHEYYKKTFGVNLDTFMIHWDNRTTRGEISKTIEAMEIIGRRGLNLGLAGIAAPAIYASLLRPNSVKSIQIKHNLFFSDIPRYASCFNPQEVSFVAYGINAGGLKLRSAYHDTSSVTLRHIAPVRFEKELARIASLVEKSAVPSKSLNTLGMIYACANPHISGLIIGPSSDEQLEEAIICYHFIGAHDQSALYRQIAALVR